MGEFSFENQALGAFMTYRLDGEETLDSLAMGMLSNNQIPGILPTTLESLKSRPARPSFTRRTRSISSAFFSSPPAK